MSNPNIHCSGSEVGSAGASPYHADGSVAGSTLRYLGPPPVNFIEGNGEGSPYAESGSPCQPLVNPVVGFLLFCLLLPVMFAACVAWIVWGLYDSLSRLVSGRPPSPKIGWCGRIVGTGRFFYSRPQSIGILPSCPNNNTPPLPQAANHHKLCTPHSALSQ